MTPKQHCKVYIASCDEKGGIYQYDLGANGVLEYVDWVALDSPMYLAVYDNMLYALLRAPFRGSNESGLVSFEIGKDGRLLHQSQVQSTKGEVACHLVVDKDGIYCVNYVSGSVMKMPDSLVVHSGSSIHPTRQTGPHTHQVVATPDGRYLCVTDLGLDQVFVYDKELQLISTVEVLAGHGPRHMVFSPDGEYAFCANELQSTVTIFVYHDGHLKRLETYSTLPKDYTEESTVAAIRISADGKFLYVSNRGHDSIACFAVSGSKLELFDLVSCKGSSPRDFNITPDGKFLLCTNENSDNVTVFQIVEGRLLVLDGEITIKKPLCVLFSDD